MANFYIHIPRTGGHSLTSSLPWGEYTYLGHDLRDPDYRHPHEVCSAADFVFTVVRDPFDRLVSAFHFLRKGGWSDLDNADAYRLGLRVQSFREFVVTTLRSASRWQIHFVPQSFWLEGVPNVRIYRFEQQAEAFKELRTRFGGDPTVQLRQLNSSARSSSVRDHYDEETADIVRDVYADDFAMLDGRLAAPG